MKKKFIKKFVFLFWGFMAVFCTHAGTYHVNGTWAQNFGKVSYPAVFTGDLDMQYDILGATCYFSFVAPSSGRVKIEFESWKNWGATYNFGIKLLDHYQKIVAIDSGASASVELKAGKRYLFTPITTNMSWADNLASYSFVLTMRREGMKILHVESNTAYGSVRGAGEYVAGKKATLKAVAKKGYAFAGWYEDAGFNKPCDSSVTDYRNLSYAYTMGGEDKVLYARFEPVVNDSILNLKVNGYNVPKTFKVSDYAQLALKVESRSLPKITVKGLPAGLKFTAKPIFKKGSKTEIETPANSIYGTPTKPGLYTVTVKLTNTTIKKAIEKKFTIEVPNFTAANGYFANGFANEVGQKYSLTVGISNIDDFMPSLRLNKNVKLAVSGLPAGLKYDAKTGKITGIATKAGIYTVTLTVTDGKQKSVSTITIKVEALPDWVVGTFEGYLSVVSTQYGYWDFHDHVILTIGANGKVKCKGQVEDASWYTYKGMSLISSGDGAFELYGEEADDDYSDIRCWRIEPAMVDGVTYGRIEGDVLIREYEEWDGIWFTYTGSAYLSQNVWEKAKGTNLIPGFVKDARVAFDMSGMEDSEGYDIIKYDGCLTLKFGNKGVVTTAYSEYEGGKATATGSAQLVPYDVDGDVVKAWLYTALKPKGRDPFGVLLFLEIDTSNGVVAGKDVSVQDYLFEVDD